VSSVFDTSANDASWATTTSDHDTATAAPTTTQPTQQPTPLTRQQIRQVRCDAYLLFLIIVKILTPIPESRNPPSPAITRKLQGPHRPDNCAPLRTSATTTTPRLTTRRPRAEPRVSQRVHRRARDKKPKRFDRFTADRDYGGGRRGTELMRT
jgi:hypothetical protein